MTSLMEEALEQLIIGSSFDELSLKDKEYVLSLMSELEYNTCHAILPGIISCFAREHHIISPSPEIIRQLKNNFRGRRRKPIALHALFGPVKLHFPGYRLILLAAILLFIWLPTELSNRKKQDPGLQKTSGIEQTYAPHHNKRALDPVKDASQRRASKRLLQKHPSVYSAVLSPEPGKDIGTSDKYLCYDIAIPIDHSKKSKAIHRNSNPPGLHANLLIPDAHP